MRKCIYIFLFFVVRISAQTYDFRNYNVDDGLAQSQVYCIYQDSKGYMWFGTNGGGASKFDGKKFQNLSTGNGGLSDYIYSIDEDKRQNLYFGTYDGLQIKNKFNDVRFDSTNGLPHNTVYKVLIDKTEKVWIGTYKGVCFLNANKKPQKLIGDKKLEGAAIWTIYQDNAGNYWFGTIQDGACCYSPSKNKFTWINTAKILNSNFVRSFNEDTKGNILIGTVAGLIEVDKEYNLKKVEFKDGYKTENLGFTNISKDKNLNLWYCTDDGIIKISGNNLEQFTTKNGLCGNIILSSYIDTEGNLWFGSDGFGISKLTAEAWVNYGVKDGLTGDYVNCIYQSKSGAYWMGIRDNGLLKMQGKIFTSFKVNTKNITAGLVDNNVNCITEYNNQLWIGTSAGLSVMSENGNLNNYLHTNGAPIAIYSILHASNGIHYLGTKKGLFVFENELATPVEIVNKLQTSEDFPVYSMLEDNNKNIWLSMGIGGAIRYDGKSIQRFNSKNKFTDKSVYNCVKDKHGNLWFGTEEGLFYYNFKEFVNVSEKEGLSSNQAYFLLFDAKNNLWIGTNKGIDELNVDEFLSGKKISIKHFGKEEGLKGLECNMNATIKDAEGKLWFGTVKGITTFNPRFEKINYNEPVCSINAIKISFEKIDLSKYSSALDSLSELPINLELPYGKNHVTFDFIGISQTNPNKVQYEFKLDGVDNDWVPPTNKTEVTYSSLQPGDYIFYLKAMNNDGFWNKEPLAFKFTVLPPWYRTWWFYTLCVIIALVAISSFNAYKTKKLRQDKIKLENEVTLRTKELREEKEKVEVINKEVIEQKTVIEHKNHEITDSIKYAKNIQEALLPAVTSLQKDFPESFVLYMPKDIVSGDFYWFAKRDGKNYFAAADCTGHGVPGAFMSIIGNALINEIIAEQHIYQPAEILNNLHVGIKTALNQNKGEFERRDGMDIALCAINKETLLLEYAGANRPLWIYRKTSTGNAEIIKPDKFPIGGLEFDFEEKRQFHNHSIQLQKGDCVYVFSDGYADQFGGPKGKKFMVANLQRAFVEITHKPMAEQYAHLHKIFTDWRGIYEQVDDVLMIGMRV